MAHRYRIIDQLGVCLVLCVLAWPVWQIVNEYGLIPFLLIPLGLALTSILIVFVLGQGLKELLAVILWSGCVLLLASSILDLETGFPGKKAKIDLSYANEPILFVLAVLANSAMVVAGVVSAVRWWRSREASPFNQDDKHRQAGVCLSSQTFGFTVRRLSWFDWIGMQFVIPACCSILAASLFGAPFVIAGSDMTKFQAWLILAAGVIVGIYCGIAQRRKFRTDGFRTPFE